MDEQRLAEIEQRLNDDGSHILCDGEDDVIELIAEVRRLRAENHELSALVEALDYQVQTR
jgi:hypothetical protein